MSGNDGNVGAGVEALRQRKGKDEQLLDGAEAVWGDSGAEELLTVRRIAARANTTSQTIYTYFGSLGQVVLDMGLRLARDANTWAETWDTARGVSTWKDEARENFSYGAAATWLQLCDGRPAMIRLARGEPVPGGPVVSAAVEPARDLLRSVFGGRTRVAQVCGLADAVRLGDLVDVELARNEIGAVILGSFA